MSNHDPADVPQAKAASKTLGPAEDAHDTEALDGPSNVEANGPKPAAATPGIDAPTPSGGASAAAPAVAAAAGGDEKPRLQGGAQLHKQTSTGTWGETMSGEPVNPSQAMQEFQLARETSRQSSRSSLPRMGRILSRSRTGRQASIIEKSHEGAKTEEEEQFDLGEWMLARKARREEDGVQSEKPLGVSWRNVNVISPTGAGAKIFVKTLPQAIINTATRDPLAILSHFIPPLRKLTGGKTTPTPLIKGHDGVLKAGEMLLVLGRPGSGCSTTLRALTNSSHSNLTAEGNITYGGLTPDEVSRKYRGETIFVDEDDIHYATLTVEQTLRFALKTKVPHRTSRLRDESREEFIDLVIDVLLKMFGMTHVRSTIVGDAAVRGVSGGERKRVTLQEALATDASVMAWDNSTRGLDASTALDYARSLRIITDIGQRTTMATLYQVSESIFDLFDRISVIDEGLCIYYGPRDQARKYFEDLGYYSPARQTTADFVCAVTDPNQVQIRSGYENKAPRTAEERERAWKSSKLYKDLLAEVGAYEAAVESNEVREGEGLKNTVRAKKNKGVRRGSPYTVNFWEQVKACMYRDLLVKWGARGDLYIKFFTIISVSLMISSLFYKQSMDSMGAFTRGGIILFACLFNGWLQLSESYEAVAGRPMLVRHGQFAFYRPSAVSISRAIIDIPFLTLQCVLSSIIIYFLSNLRVNAGAFFIFLVYTFLCAYNLTALYRAFAAFAPGFNEAIRFSVLGLNCILIFVGYVIRRPQMNWLVWINWSNGISYGFSGMLSNEFKYPIECNPAQIVPFNAAMDPTYQTCSLTGGRPGSLVVPGEDYLSTTFGYSQSNVGPYIGVLIAFSALYLIVTVIASELMDYGAGGGGVTVFAKTKRAQREIEATRPASADDMEAAAVRTDQRSPTSDRPSTQASSSEVTPVDTQPPSRDFGHPDKAAEGKQHYRKQHQQTLERIKTHEDKPIFSWSDLQLTLPNGRKLLQHVDGYVRPGTMTALMGASGAGKTTLMTALSQRGAAGVVTGDMLVDGKPLGPGFQKSTGLVLQADVHLATQTVREAIEFSALLRQPREVPREEKLRDAQHAIDLLELNELQDALIGAPGAGLSVERRKRVTIAVELAAKPDLLLFLDEPTSGLDSAGAASICRLLRRLAEDGQAILCTIHQPSALLFESFDNVLLLAPGGRTTYFGQIGEHHGHGSDRIRTYFERNGAEPCDPQGNVAEYILEVVSGGKQHGKNWGDVWLNSEECHNIRSDIDQIVKTRKERPEKVDPRAQREFATPLMEQYREVTLRQFKDLWREPSFAYAILFSNFVTGLVAGGAFAKLGLSPVDYQNRVFIEFLVILSFPAVVNSVIAKFFELRMLFEVRESASKIYHWSAMIAAFIITSAPVAVVSSVIYWLPSFFIPYESQPTTKAGYFYLMVLLINLFEIEFSLMLAAASPTPVTAANLLPFLLPILAIVNGVIVPHAQMPQPWKAVYWANPLSYYLRGTIGTMLHGTPVICNEEDTARFNPPVGQTCTTYAGQWAQQAGGYLVNPNDSTNCGYCQYTVGDQFSATLSANYSQRWENFGIFLCYVAGNVFAAFALFWWFRVKGYGLGVAPVKKLVMKPFQSKKE